jgi:AcrR family transcriptional regulator
MTRNAASKRRSVLAKARTGRVADRGSLDETRDRLLTAAESLFVELGYDGTTLRLVASHAQANVAAANYHFGGKDALLQSMLARRLDVLARSRLALLAAYEQEHGARALSCERAMAALCAPALSIARDPARGGQDFLRLLGRAYVDPSPTLRTFLEERYASVTSRFREAFSRALPRLPKRELSWRLHFVLGALSYTMARTDAWNLIGSIRSDDEDDEHLLARLVPFVLAGLQAPQPTLLPHSLRIVAGGAPRARSRARRTIVRRVA